MKYDLHVHSEYSDGIKTMMELGSEAKAAGLGGFAITDHDTIAGWSEIQKVEKTFGIVIFPGVELNTEWQKKDVHILGYAMTDEETFREKLVFLSKARITRVENIVEKLNHLGISITLDEVMDVAGKGTVGRPHVAAVLAQKGYTKDLQDAFHRFINRGKPAYVERVSFSPFDAIEMIRSCGGYAVLAHPGIDNAILFLEGLVQAGLNGIEAYHSAHTTESAARFEDLAKQYGLFVTAGSDYHGYSDEKHGFIGSKGLSKEDLPQIFEPYLYDE
jgi:hypothetical protein